MRIVYHRFNEKKSAKCLKMICNNIVVRKVDDVTKILYHMCIYSCKKKKMFEVKHISQRSLNYVRNLKSEYKTCHTYVIKIFIEIFVIRNPIFLIPYK